MRLAAFIERAKERILGDAVVFARTLTVLTEADEGQIRDHIPEMLQNIVDDLRRSQSEIASIAKSQGRAAAADIRSQADTHGLQRARAGLSIDQLLAEYRALRSSVLRLWGEELIPDQDAFRDIGRFNEAIDQAIAESVRAFASETEFRRQLFLAGLGHDLRGPLQAIGLTASAIAYKGPPSIHAYTSVLTRSAERMSGLLDSLLDYNLVGLGGAMTVKRSKVDLKVECEEEVEILRAALPKANIELTVAGDCWGEFDSSRIREALGNLVSNAAKHGVDSQPVEIKVHGAQHAVVLTVSNAIEEPIPSAELALLFEPMRRRAKAHSSDRKNLGLGLFITKEIAKAHGGEALALCNGDKISFTITIPSSGIA